MEPLYRRNQDGMMTEVVPQAQGKAAALSSYLAQGGTPFRKSGRFKKGPMKGKNVDEATAEFERMWASAPDSLKQKYANRTSGKMTDLAPSERQTVAKAALDPAKVAKYGPKLAATYAETAAAPKTTVTPAQAAPLDAVQVGATAPAGDQSTAALGTPAQQEEVRKMMGEGEKFGTAFMAVPGTVSTDGLQDMGARAAAGMEKFREETYTPGRAAEKKRIREEDAAYYAKHGMTPPDSVPTDGRKIYSEEEKAAARVDSAPTGAPQTPTPTPAAPAAAPAAAAPITPATPARGINRATGLPFGYRPGDAVALAQQAAANESVARQKAASLPRATPVKPTFLSQSAINRPRTTTEGVEGRAAAEMRRQAGINANPATKNQDDPRKFFTGRVKPLTQLVAAR